MSTPTIRAALDAAEQHATFKIWAGHPLAIILEGLVKKIRAALNAEAPPTMELGALFDRHCFEDDYGNKYMNAEAFESAALEFAARTALDATPAAPEVQRDAVIAAVTEALGDAYDCQRVWHAWSVGTMGQDDFALVAEDSDRVAEIADAAIAAMRPAAPAASEVGKSAHCARIELVTAIHCLASHFETACSDLDGDDLQKAKNDIAHARRIAANHNQNGTGCPQFPSVTPAAPEPGEVGELVAWIHRQAIHGPDADEWRRAAALLQQQQHSLKLALQAQLDLLMEQLPAPAPAVVPVAYDAGGGITIHRTRQEPEAWAVRRDLDSLALDGTWDHEPAPSDRTQEWLARHRFASAEAAAHAIPLPQAGEGE